MPTTSINAAASSGPWIRRSGVCRQFSSRYSMKGGPNAGTFWLKRALLLGGRSKYE